MSDSQFMRGRRFAEHITGVPYVRDTEHPCEFFVPCLYGAGEGECQGDGHYLCRECELHDEVTFIEMEKYDQP